MTPNVRKATAADVPAIRRALARAFYDDPILAWNFPKEATRLKYAGRFFAGRARTLLRQDEVYTVDGAHAAAMWARPGEWEDPPLDAARQALGLFPGVGRRALRALKALRDMESRHPREPHWYLAALGTDPDHQGKGIASALLAPILAECDRLEIPAYLETGTERNVAFYTRHGWHVVDELTLPKGPPVWLMWRDPRP